MRLSILKFMMALPILVGACSKKAAPDHTQLYEEIRHVNRMEFASLAVTKTVKTERTDWYKVGKRIAVYSYDTHLKAFIDMNLLAPDDIEFDEENKTVRVTLPPVQVEIAGRDMEMRKEYENVGMFRTEISSQERAKMKEKANTELKKELEGNPEYKQRLEQTARRKARTYFETLFRNEGYTPYIRFSDESSPSGDFNLTNYD
ncbi:MAG: DUF4230 domain-containing protein [Muribaculaceae bacterium]|nr:DUF4230 domain-containing protein [Muribaculaceae bacterium]